MHVNQRGLSSGDWRARDYKVNGILEDDTVLKRGGGWGGGGESGGVGGGGGGGLAERVKMLEAVSSAEHARSWGWELVMRLDAEQ